MAKMMPINRQAGPRAIPAIRLRRNIMNSAGNRHITLNRNANRREMAPSTVGRTR